MFTIGKHSTGCDGGVDSPIVTIGNYTRIAHTTIFYGRSNYPSINHPLLVCNYDFPEHDHIGNFEGMGSKGPITVGNDVWIGYDCAILSGVTIGDGAIIGMRTVVSKDVPPYGVAVGSPMVIKKYRFSPEIIEKLEKIKWWDWPDELVKERINDFLDVNKFVEKYGN